MLQVFVNSQMYLRAYLPNWPVVREAPTEEMPPQPKSILFSVIATMAFSACVGCMAAKILRK